MALNAGSRLMAHGLTSPSRPQETEKSNIPVQRTRGKHPNPTGEQRGAAPAQWEEKLHPPSLVACISHEDDRRRRQHRRRRRRPRRSDEPWRKGGDGGPLAAKRSFFAEGVGTNVEDCARSKARDETQGTRTRYRWRQRTDGVGVGVGVGDGDGDGEPNDVNGELATGRCAGAGRCSRSPVAGDGSFALSLRCWAGWRASYRCQHPARWLSSRCVSSEYLVAEWRAEQVEVSDSPRSVSHAGRDRSRLAGDRLLFLLLLHVEFTGYSLAVHAARRHGPTLVDPAATARLIQGESGSSDDDNDDDNDDDDDDVFM
ncbi:uncharacterized protein ARB_02594 [Trichophyton benhamiae CBS 112371]|uniref:Uncharacterized protein n=1 Tax=Arthroderma benhamiae (strain ATCC MYA-4681 / CBS 112371) TaxID=663331 RepID=D4B2I6_ARTBC|nr:uncharacterized protein ARB_02594 [Trichophyton benhamiae CBS 112371]EFE30432.1 hypothetical protein ARB_02594 [Trichophyton benhamiae CBS 112371]